MDEWRSTPGAGVNNWATVSPRSVSLRWCCHLGPGFEVDDVNVAFRIRNIYRIQSDSTISKAPVLEVITVRKGDSLIL